MTQDFAIQDIGSMLPFTAIFEALSESSILIQNDAPKYTIVAATPEYVSMIGTTKEYLIGKGMFEAYPPNPNDPTDTGSQDVKASLEMVRQHKKPHQLPVQRYDVAGADGYLNERYWKAINKPVFSSDGEVAYIIHTAEDITAVVKAEEKETEHRELLKAYQKIQESQTALHESESKYRTLFESMDQGFCVLEMIYGEYDEPIDYRFLEANPVFEKQTGLKDAINKTARQLVPDLEEHWVKLYGKVALTGESLRFLEKSKAMGRWFDVYAFKIEDRDSRKVALLFTDVTERKQAEKALILSEERQSFLLKLSDCLRSLTDPTEMQYEAASLLGAHLGANRVGYAEDTGDGETIIVTRNYTNGVVGIEGQYKYDDYGPELLREFREGRTVVRNNIAEDTSLSEEEKQAHHSIQIGASINVPMLKNNRLFGILFMHRETAYNWSYPEIELIKETADRTWEAVERARTQAALQRSEEELEKKVQQRTIELEKANQELQRSNTHLGEFAHAASHDLKEPIRKIQTFASRLKDTLVDRMDERESDVFQRMQLATKRMALLVDDLLTYSQVSAVAFQMETVDLTDKIQVVLSDLEVQIEEKKAVINIENLPSVKGYKRQLQQLFQNLISNALKYSKKDVPPQITIRSEVISGVDVQEHFPTGYADTLYHFIAVEDNGIGFDQQYAERIFNMFQRLHGKNEYEGTGIGLSIVRKVVNNHDGYIWAESKPGEGSTFKLLLPVTVI